MFKGKEGALLFQGEVGMRFAEGMDDCFVFFGFEAAGAVDQDSTGLYFAGGNVEKVELDFCQTGDFGGLDAPAEIDPAAHHAGVGAGSIDEDAVVGSA